MGLTYEDMLVAGALEQAASVCMKFATSRSNKFEAMIAQSCALRIRSDPSWGNHGKPLQRDIDNWSFQYYSHKHLTRNY